MTSNEEKENRGKKTQKPKTHTHKTNKQKKPHLLNFPHVISDSEEPW